MGLNITVHGSEQLCLKYKFRLSGKYIRLSDSMTKSNKICYDKYAITTVGVSGLKEKKTKKLTRKESCFFVGHDSLSLAKKLYKINLFLNK